MAHVPGRPVAVAAAEAEHQVARLGGDRVGGGGRGRRPTASMRARASYHQPLSPRGSRPTAPPSASSWVASRGGSGDRTGAPPTSGSTTVSVLPCHSPACSSRATRNVRGAAARAAMLAQRLGLGGDQRPGELVPADLRVREHAPARLGHLHHRLAVRPGRADAHRQLDVGRGRASAARWWRSTRSGSSASATSGATHTPSRLRPSRCGTPVRSAIGDGLGGEAARAARQEAGTGVPLRPPAGATPPGPAGPAGAATAAPHSGRPAESPAVERARRGRGRPSPPRPRMQASASLTPNTVPVEAIENLSIACQ